MKSCFKTELCEKHFKLEIAKFDREKPGIFRAQTLKKDHENHKNEQTKEELIFSMSEKLKSHFLSKTGEFMKIEPSLTKAATKHKVTLNLLADSHVISLTGSAKNVGY